MDDGTAELEEVRSEIDRIDDGIAESVAERVDAAETVAAVKSRTGTDLVDQDREADVKSRYAERFEREGLPAQRGRELAALLIEVSLEREREREQEQRRERE